MTNAEIYERYGKEKGQEMIDRKNAKTKAWYHSHKEHHKKYIEEHREHINEIARKYQSKHREVQQARVNEYHKTLSGRAMNLYTSMRQYDAEHMGVLPVLTREDIVAKAMGVDSRCVYCGCDDPYMLGLDRINNRTPHHVWNTVTCCKRCNCKRNRRTFEEFLALKNLTLEEWMANNDGRFSDGLIIS